jgi:vacuolar-type H+-ATPase subunit I/STV1
LGVACHLLVVLFFSGFYGAGFIMGDLGTFLIYFILALGFLHMKNEKAQTKNAF